MASTVPKPVESKQLGDLLQEQQEPFTLDVYLQEKGCLKNNMDSKNNFKCCYGNSRKFLKRSTCCGLNKSKKVFPNCSNVVKCVLIKFVSANVNPRMKNSGSNSEISVTEIGTKTEDAAESDRFSSASGTTVFNSCSESDAEDVSKSLGIDHEFATTDTDQKLKDSNHLSEKETQKLQWRCVEDSKQLSPVSVLDEILSEDGSPFHNKHQNPKTGETETPSTSTSKNVINHKKVKDDLKLCKLLVHSEILGSNNSSQYLISKRVLQKSKQLLLDCVTDVLQTHVWKETRGKGFRGFLGPEEIGKVLGENIRTWTKHPGNETNTTQLLNLDLLASVREWNDFSLEIKRFATLIGDSIFEDFINEIVKDMI